MPSVTFSENSIVFDRLFQKKKASTSLAAKQKQTKQHQVDHPYAAVKIVTLEQRSCLEIKRTASKVYLCSEAPQIPLADCERKNACVCRYKHLSDRRSLLRRDADNGLPNNHIGSNRRNRIERRCA